MGFTEDEGFAAAIPQGIHPSTDGYGSKVHKNYAKYETVDQLQAAFNQLVGDLRQFVGRVPEWTNDVVDRISREGELFWRDKRVPWD